MKRIMIIAGLAAAIAAAWPAFAQPRSQQGSRGVERPDSLQPTPPSRPADMRGQDREPPRKAVMTPEERRDLRRDIRDHGREVYRDPPPNRGRQR
jgi:hypothetical protein